MEIVMNTNYCTQTIGAGSRRAAPAHTSGLRRTFWRWWTRYMQRRALMELPESVLVDLGLTRADIRNEAAKPSRRA